MKKTFILTALLFGFATVSMGQEKTEKKPERLKLMKVSTPETTAVGHSKTTEKKKLTPAEELKACEANLEAIEKKSEWIKSNPEELKMAQESGWFEKAEKTKRYLNARIKELKQQLK